mgnify:CR=1 FL=1
MRNIRTTMTLFNSIAFNVKIFFINYVRNIKIIFIIYTKIKITVINNIKLAPLSNLISFYRYIYIALQHFFS